MISHKHIFTHSQKIINFVFGNLSFYEKMENLESEDLAVLKKMRQGDVAALEYFFHKYTDLLYSRALGYLRDPFVAEDIVEEVFVRFWDKRKKLEITLSVLAYLTRSVVNTCKNYLEYVNVRQRYESDYYDDNQEEAMIKETVFDEEEFESLRVRLKLFIDSLPEKCREIFILACIDGMKYREVAERLGVSVNTVKTQVKVAYAKLRTDFDVKEQEFIIIFLLFQQLI